MCKLFCVAMSKSFSFADFEQIEEQPGCYGLYIDWNRIKESDFQNDANRRSDFINAIFKVYAPNPIFINAARQIFNKKQYFGEHYEGTLSYSEIRINDIESRLSKSYTLFRAFLEFTNFFVVPIYIGKSKNLNRRIKQHMYYLENSKIINDLETESADVDSFKNFSERFAFIMKDCTPLGLRTAMFSVRLVYLEENEITEFESNLNYLYRPLFGLK